MGAILYFSPLRNVLKINISFQLFAGGSDEFYAAEFLRTLNLLGVLIKGVIMIF